MHLGATGRERESFMTNLFRLVMNEGLNARYCTLLKVGVVMHIYFATLVSTFHPIRDALFFLLHSRAAYFHTQFQRGTVFYRQNFNSS